MWYENVIQLIGNTPLVKLNRVTQGVPCTLLAKLEYISPGSSVKDRIGIKMIDVAEKEGKLKPGGTIIECTSGNTGLGLAIASAIKGYKCIFVMPDKMSQEKIDVLRAFGAEVIVTPTAVEPKDPRSYYSVAARLAKEIPNSYHTNQYENPANPLAHYETTGPELWAQTEGKITAFVAGMGTGGTISGSGKYLKEKNPKVEIVGVDPAGSIYYEFFKSGKVIEKPKTYLTEGIGEDFFPGAMDMKILDEIVQVSDKEAMLMTRALARREGVFCGSSGGAAVHGAVEYCKRLPKEALVVVLIPDTGMRYLTKVHSDRWMRENRMLDTRFEVTAGDILERKNDRLPRLVSVMPEQLVFEAMTQMREYGVSQLPVVHGTDVVGSIREDQVIPLLVQHKDTMNLRVREIMGKPFPVLEADARIEDVGGVLTQENPAVLVRDREGQLGIITKHDLITTIAR